MYEEMQAVQVTLEGIKVGAELSAKSLRTLRNLLLAIGSGIKKTVINYKDKSLLNARGSVDPEKIFKMTKNVQFLKLSDEKLDLFYKECKKYHVPVALMDKYEYQGKEHSYIMYPSHSAPSIAQIMEVLKNKEMADYKKKGEVFNENEYDVANCPVSMEEYAKDIGADRSDFIEENKDKLDTEILNSANKWKDKSAELEEKKSKLKDGITYNDFKCKSESIEYDVFTFKKEDVLSGADFKHQNIKVSDDYSVELPKNLKRKENKDGSISVLIKKDNDFVIISNKDKSRSDIKGIDIKNYTASGLDIKGNKKDKTNKQKKIIQSQNLFRKRVFYE